MKWVSFGQQDNQIATKNPGTKQENMKWVSPDECDNGNKTQQRANNPNAHLLQGPISTGAKTQTLSRLQNMEINQT